MMPHLLFALIPRKDIFQIHCQRTQLNQIPILLNHHTRNIRTWVNLFIRWGDDNMLTFNRGITYTRQLLNNRHDLVQGRIDTQQAPAHPRPNSSRKSAGEPCPMICPSRMMTTLSHTCSASDRICVLNSTVWSCPNSRTKSRNSNT